ncbi:MAG TPA: DUF3556 domain-containing protein [Solirubrobacterales bacterium]|jgi:hypothetical protein|nr:DUF3556 domain-containing protein [Solirubrobacterales bacterium]
MGFFSPAEPPFSYAEWRRRPHLERIKPLAQDWALNGFGTPYFVYLLYIVKIAVYAVGGLLLISATTPHLGGLGDLSSWWSEPIVFQKAVVWTMLWEVLGLGAGSLPLTLRFSPMIGGVLYWLRPGTTRLPPWPDRVPLTRGTRRTWFDVALYAALVAAALELLLSGADRLDPAAVAVLLAILVALGLRDKVPFLAARAEIYGSLMVIFLFPLTNLIVAAQLVFVCIWWGAASSKLNRHFPFVVTVMISNTPWNRSRALKRRLYRDHPDDLRPSRLGELDAHLGTAIEFTLPLLLLVTSGGAIGTIAVAGMVIFHLHILSTFPLAVPLEWNLFMIFGLLFLFGHYGEVPFSTLEDPLLLVILAVICVGVPVLGNFRPDLISFLPSMRYYAGNWATSQWLFRRGGAEEKLDGAIVKSAPIVTKQLARFYDEELIDVLVYKGLAFRSMHSHGRALNALSARAVDDIEDYDVREGELVAGVVLGYNFGDGHFHNEQLLAAVQERCRYEPGELRVVTLESQPAHRQRQRYRIFDAATGLVEEGFVRVADMVVRQPWLGEGAFPVEPAGASRLSEPMVRKSDTAGV